MIITTASLNSILPLLVSISLGATLSVSSPVMESRDFFLESRSRRSCLGPVSKVLSRSRLEGFRSRSRALRLETLQKLFFMKVFKE